MKKFLLAVFMLGIGVSSVAFAGEKGVDAMNLKSSVSYKDYTIKIYEGGSREDGIGSLEIFKNGQKVYSKEKEEGRFEIGVMFEEDPHNKLSEVGQDITGDGEPNLVVSHFEAPGHARLHYYVFSLGKEFKLIDALESGDNHDAAFKDIDGDGKYEFLAVDQTFAYWYESFSGSPEPQIILKYENGHYRLAMDLMRKPLPTDEEENQAVKKMKEITTKVISSDEFAKLASDSTAVDTLGYWVSKEVALPSEVWGRMLELIYTGHADAAWRFLHKIWPEGKSGEEQFLTEFKKQLAQSPYWKDLKEGQVVKGSL